MFKEKISIKPQDILILLKLLAHPERTFRMIDMAYEIGISQSEVSQGLERLRIARLVDSEKKRVHSSAAFELLVYGVKYFFPVRPGPWLAGIPTAHSAAPFLNKIMASPQERYVWPYSEGEVKGQSIEPLYPSVPKAAKFDPKLYELLAIVDALRVGRAREQKFAQAELKKRVFVSENKDGRNEKNTELR